MRPEEFNNDDYNMRFGGVARLYGTAGLTRLLKSHVMVVGLGGVGSWVAESLARSGVGAITLVDLDDICITNTNRQLPAMDKNFGKLKVEIMKERILAINPQCDVRALAEFFTEQTADALLDSRCDYVIDAIDSLANKALLVTKCKERNVPVLVTGGAAGKTNPLMITKRDMAEVENDSLIFRLRKKLRNDGIFPPGHKSSRKKSLFHILCIYSPEDPVYPTPEGGVCSIPDSESGISLDCESGMGSISHVTAIFGLVASGHVINAIASTQAN